MSEETIRTALVEHWREIYPPDETMLAPRFLVIAEVIDSDGDDSLRLMHMGAHRGRRTRARDPLRDVPPSCPPA